MATTIRPECDTYNKVMSISQAVVFIVAGVTYVTTSCAWTVPCPSWRTTASASRWTCSGG